MKELPYFRFTSQEWQNGNISLENYELKGLFIDICAYYWIKNCSITLAMLEKKFRDAKPLIQELINLDIILLENDNIQISFLNEQFDLLSEKRTKRIKAGRLGGQKKSSNAKAMLKQKSSYKDKDKYKDKYKDNIKEREEIFKNTLNSFAKIYSKNMLIDFYNYWSEKNKKDKMRFELEKTWDISKRLARWNKNNINKEEKIVSS